jgi:DNA-binding CsgD family transcriptional regulator
MKYDRQKWIFLNSIVFLAWIFVFIVNIPYLQKDKSVSFFCFILECILFAITFVILGINYVEKYRFTGYGILCMLWGCEVILAKGGLIGFITFSLSYLFFWRQNFLSSPKVKYILFALFTVPFILLFVSGDNSYICHTLWYLAAFFIICLLAAYLLYPLYSKKGVVPEKILNVKRYDLSDREIDVLKDILQGKKYTVIATELSCSLSTIQKDISDICDKLSVSDKTELLIKYSGCSVTTI